MYTQTLQHSLRAPTCQNVRVALAPEFKEAVDTYIEENKVLVFIKGSKVCAASSVLQPYGEEGRRPILNCFDGCRTSHSVGSPIQSCRFAPDLRPHGSSDVLLAWFASARCLLTFF